jgi:hypothetical protein
MLRSTGALNTEFMIRCAVAADTPVALAKAATADASFPPTCLAARRPVSSWLSVMPAEEARPDRSDDPGVLAAGAVVAGAVTVGVVAGLDPRAAEPMASAEPGTPMAAAATTVAATTRLRDMDDLLLIGLDSPSPAA